MLDWSKSYEMYLGLSEKQRLSIGRKSHDILVKEMENLCDEEALRPAIYLMSLAPFMSLSDEFGLKEYRFFKEIAGYREPYQRFLEVANKGKDEKVNKFLRVYFQKVGGDVLTAYLSLALAFLTIKGEIKDEEKALIEEIHG